MTKKIPMWYYDAESPCVTCQYSKACPHADNNGFDCDRFMDAACEEYSITKESACKGYFEGLTSTLDRLNSFIGELPMSGTAEWLDNDEWYKVMDFALEGLVDMTEDEYNKGIVQTIYSMFVSLTLSGTDWYNIRKALEAATEYIR